MHPLVSDKLVDRMGLWCERVSARLSAGKPALFIDRDGVIVEEMHYLARPEDVRVIRSAAAAIRAANQLGMCVVVVTNQSGIGRGYYGWQEFERVQERIIEELAGDGAYLDVVMACAYHDEASGQLAIADHAWRKPNGGMITSAAQMLDTDLPNSLMVGDKRIDLEAGRSAGVGTGILVRTGHGAAEATRFDPTILRPMRVSIENDISGIEPWLRTVRDRFQT